MKVLACHNYYLQAGGEDQSYASEIQLLESHGHAVRRFTLDNRAIANMGRIELAKKTIFNQETYNEVETILKDWEPDVIHCTNTFPLISPAIYYVAFQLRIPVVQSLRNYRLLCPNAYLMRRGSVCERCLKKTFKWPSVRFACYRNNRSATTVVATMLAIHKLIGTWDQYIDRYFAMTEFAKTKFIQAGFPESKLKVKPNFLLEDPGPCAGAGGYAVFVGRLSPEKGLDALLEAWRLRKGNQELRIIGDGPMLDQVQHASRTMPGVKLLGRMAPEQVLEQVGNARCFLLPSTWYEGMPRTIIEAFSRGTPVIAFGLGAMKEIIDHNATGLLVEPGNNVRLAAAIDQAFAWSDEEYQRIRCECRSNFLRLYSAATNYEMLMQIYSEAIASKRQAIAQAIRATSKISAWPTFAGHSYE